MTKPEHFRQGNPYDQQIAVLSGLEGHFSNLEDGIITPQQFLEKTKSFIADLRLLVNWQDNKWEHEIVNPFL